MVLPADQYKGYFKDSELTEEEKKKFKIDPKDAALLAADFIPVVSDVKAVYDFPEDMKFAGQLWEQSKDAETTLGKIGLKTAGAGYGAMATLGAIPVAGYAFRKGKKALKGGLKLLDKDKQLELPFEETKKVSVSPSLAKGEKPKKKLYHAARSLSTYDTDKTAPSGLIQRVTDPEVAKRMGFKPFTAKEIKMLEDAPIDQFQAGKLVEGGRSDVLYKLLKSRGEKALGRHTYLDLDGNEVEWTMPRIRKDQLTEEGFSSYESFVTAPGLNNTSTGVHMELGVHGLSLSRDPLMSAHSFTRNQGMPVQLSRKMDESTEYRKAMGLDKYEMPEENIKRLDDMIDDMVYTEMPKGGVNLAPEGYNNARYTTLLNQSKIYSGKSLGIENMDNVKLKGEKFEGETVQYPSEGFKKFNAEGDRLYSDVQKEMYDEWKDTANLPKGHHTEFETTAFRPDKLAKPKKVSDNPELAKNIKKGIVQSNKAFRQLDDWTYDLEKFIGNETNRDLARVRGEGRDSQVLRESPESIEMQKDALKIYHKIRENIKLAKGLGAYTEGGARGSYDKWWSDLGLKLEYGSGLDTLADALPPQKAANIHALSFLMKLKSVPEIGSHPNAVRKARKVTVKPSSNNVYQNIEGMLSSESRKDLIMQSEGQMKKRGLMAMEHEKYLDLPPAMRRIMDKVVEVNQVEVDGSVIGKEYTVILDRGDRDIQDAFKEITDKFNRGGLVSRN